MKKVRYPKKGEIVWCSLNPIKGHEQAGSRPCLIVSGSLFNQKTGLMVVCPITSTNKGDYFFRVKMDTPKIKGFIMVDQIRTLDWRERMVRHDGAVGASALREIYDKLSILFDAI